MTSEVWYGVVDGSCGKEVSLGDSLAAKELTCCLKLGIGRSERYQVAIDKTLAAAKRPRAAPNLTRVEDELLLRTHDRHELMMRWQLTGTFG